MGWRQEIAMGMAIHDPRAQVVFPRDALRHIEEEAAELRARMDGFAAALMAFGHDLLPRPHPFQCDSRRVATVRPRRCR